MTKDPRLSHQTLLVLHLFLQQPNKEFAGAGILKQTTMSSGTVYPILSRLEKASWLRSKWENVDPSIAGRPRKRLYRLTSLGHKKTRAALTKLSITKRNRQ
jgi:DNA-binding PadR family transcriptional regulator